MGGVNVYNLSVVLFIALGSFTYGFNSSIIGSVTALPAFYEYFELSSAEPRAGYTTNMVGAMNSVYAAGGLVGCLSLGAFADRLGRKLSIQLITCMCIIASIVTTASISMPMFLVGRALQGLSSGMINTICPIYQSEISPPNARGQMVGSHAALLVCGYAGASWVGLGTYFESTYAVQWRLCIALQTVAPLILLIGSPWLPESPRWLIYYDRPEKGFEVLQRLHRRSGEVEDLLAREEFLQIRQQVILDRQNEMSWMALWKSPSTRKRLLMGFFVIAAAQSSGVLVVNNYQITLYKGLGITGWKALLLLSIYTSWAAFMNWINAFLLDRLGRIRLMTFGMIGAAVAISCEAAMVAQFAGSNNPVGNGFGIFFLFLFITCFAGGMDASCYVFTSEIFPTWMRAQGVSFSVAGLFTSTLVYTGSASLAFASIGWKYYLVFVIVPLVCVVIIWFYLPETNGLTLEEIGKIFGDSVALDLGNMTTEERAALDTTLIEGQAIEIARTTSSPVMSPRAKEPQGDVIVGQGLEYKSG